MGRISLIVLLWSSLSTVVHTSVAVAVLLSDRFSQELLANELCSLSDWVDSSLFDVVFFGPYCGRAFPSFYLPAWRSSLEALSIDFLRVESLYQNAGERYGIDHALHTLSSFRAVYTLSPEPGGDEEFALLSNLIQVLPLHLQPSLYHVSVSGVGQVLVDLQDFMAFHFSSQSDTARLLELGKPSQELYRVWLGEEGRHGLPPLMDDDTSAYVRAVIGSSSANGSSCLNTIDVAANCSSYFVAEDELVLGSIQHRRTEDDQAGDDEDIDGAKSAQLPPIRLLCMVYTTTSHRDAVQSIRSTWARHCDGFIAFSNQTDEDISAVHVVDSLLGPSPESYDHMWPKTQAMWRFVGASVLDDFDFFLAGGDDLFVLVNNLRRLLNSERIRTLRLGGHPVYLGRLLHANKYLQFVSGGSGYVLDALAVRVLLRALTEMPERCLSGIVASMEDLLVGQCLLQAGLSPLDWLSEESEGGVFVDDVNDIHSSDLSDLSLVFHPLSPAEAFVASADWYVRMVDKFRAGIHCCSPRSVSFQNIRPPRYNMHCMYQRLYS